MDRKNRFIVSAILFLSILLPTHSQVAWAARLSDQGPVGINESQSGAADHGDNGTVKPPPSEIVITESGTYSIGGFCTLTITLNSPDVQAVVHVEHPLPRGLPDDFHRIRQGCHVIYYRSGDRIDELTPALGSATICFAGIPKKQMQLYYYNIHSNQPTWSPAETSFNGGIACGPGNSSGVYVATFTKP